MIDELLEEIKKRVENKEVISPNEWLDTADKLNVLRAEFDDKLWQLGEEINKVRSIYLEQGKTVAYSEVLVKSSKLYTEWGKLKSKLERITESIRLAKIRAKGSLNEFKGY